jgi:PmbA protein
VSSTPFAYTRAQLLNLVTDVLALAKAGGATAAEAEVSEGVGQNVGVRMGEVETIEYNRDKGVSVTVYIGQHKGNASTSDLSAAALAATVEKALTIARYTAADPFAGLADPALLATTFPALDLYHPWDLPVEQAITLARNAEESARAVDARITNSEGASVSTQQGQYAYGNSHGFLAADASSRHSMSCSVIAEDQAGMQRDYWYTMARAASDLEAAAAVGACAGTRAVRRLGGRRIKTTQVPVIFEAGLATGLIGAFVGAVSGGNLYRKSSFLLDSLGKQVFSPVLQITEAPHLPRGLASSGFDSEGVATRERVVVRDGVVQGYFLGSYSARKLGMHSTGNAGGNHNLLVADTGVDFAGLLRQMGTGLVVTELLGHGLNMVTGDYSRGAAGFWVEHGEIAYPVEEVTIAGNLADMFRGIAGIGSDTETRGSKRVGSVLIDRMTVAGD